GFYGSEQISKAAAVRFDQDDVCARCQGVSPFHIQRFFEFPVFRRVYARQSGGASRLRHDRKAGRWSNSEGRVERLKIGLDIGVVEGIDDRDRLAGTERSTRKRD